MKVKSVLALKTCALLIFVSASQAATPFGSDAGYRSRGRTSSTKDGVTHQAEVSAGLDERSGFETGLFVDGEARKGSQKGGQYGERKDERWFAGARGGVQAGAFAEASASQSGRVGKVDIENYAEGETFVGSEAGVQAGVSNNGVGLGANAFTGGRVSGKVGTEVGPAGVAATGEAWSGLGAEAGVNVTMKDGKLKLGGELGAALGVGGKLGAEITIDTRPIGKVAKGAGQFASGAGKKVGKTAGKVGRHIGKAGKNVGRTVGGWFRK